MDYHDVNWRSLGAGAKRRLLDRARSYFQRVALGHGIPEAVVRDALRKAEDLLRGGLLSQACLVQSDRPRRRTVALRTSV